MKIKLQKITFLLIGASLFLYFPQSFAEIKIVENPWVNKGSVKSDKPTQSADNSDKSAQKESQAHPNNSSAKNFLWEVKSKTGTAYLLGSIHMFKRHMYPLNESIEEAYKKSDVLAVEVNMNKVTDAQKASMTANAFYNDGTTLKDHISKDSYNLLENSLLNLGSSPEMYAGYRPWFLSLQLTQLFMTRLGFDARYGIDQHFLDQADSERKPIDELESFGAQMSFFIDLSQEDQERLLVYTIQDWENMSETLDKLVNSWLSGDSAFIEDEMINKVNVEHPDFKPLMEKLLFIRNINMSGKIENYLSSGRTYFVVVGAAHLVGERGIVRLLENKGYTVRQL